MPKFEFTLVITGIDPNDDAFEDRLYEAGCDDALVSVVKGAVVLDFVREAKNFTHAVASAILDARKAGADVVRIGPDSYATLSDIAERTGLTRQAVSLLIQGKRGPGGFPPPAARVDSDSPLWDWYTVALWLCRHRKLEDHKLLVQAALTRELNGILEIKREPITGGRVLERILGRSGQAHPPGRIGAAGR
jgi:transcriptional regulator with XRE-family HTH domain